MLLKSDKLFKKVATKDKAKPCVLGVLELVSSSDPGTLIVLVIGNNGCEIGRAGEGRPGGANGGVLLVLIGNNG